MQSDWGKTGLLSGWDWASDDACEWGRGKRVMVPQHGSGCQDFELHVEGEGSLLPRKTPPLPFPFSPLPQ